MLKFTGTPPIFTSDISSIQVVMHGGGDGEGEVSEVPIANLVGLMPGLRSIFPSCAEYVPSWNIILAEKSPHVVNMLGDLVTTGVTRKGTDNECLEVMDILLSNDADIDDIDAVPQEKKDIRWKKTERREGRREKESREERREKEKIVKKKEERREKRKEDEREKKRSRHQKKGG